MLVVAKDVRVNVTEPADLALDCQHDTLPDERHRMTGSGSVRKFSVAGLLAASHYDCVLTATADSREASVGFGFDTDPLPDGLPDLINTVAPGFSPTGYTLMNSFNELPPLVDITALAVDPEGRVRWYWFVAAGGGGGLDVSLSATGDILFGGGNNVPPTLMTPSSVVSWRAPSQPSIGDTYHHHAQELPSGEIVSLTDADNEADGDTWLGFGVEIIDPASGEQTWSWSSQTGVDRGQLFIPGVNIVDPYHANSVAILEDDLGPAAWISLAFADRIIRVDRATGDITHTLGQRGNLPLRAIPGGFLLNPDQWFYGQHDPEFDWPRMIVHDNGYGRPGLANYSRVLELEIDLVAEEALLVWSWSEDGWYEPLMGDADRLEGGNILISRGRCWDFCPVGEGDRASNITEISPAGEALWRLDFGDRQGVYRSERVDGCALFNNVAYCPELAD